jgi:DNA-binding response OmpR family regulator
MDLRMPVMDGLDAARGIRAMDRPDAATIPIIALTANTTEEDVRNTMAAGMNAHLPKPVDIDTLYNTLGRLIAEKKQDKSDQEKIASSSFILHTIKGHPTHNWRRCPFVIRLSYG